MCKSVSVAVLWAASVISANGAAPPPGTLDPAFGDNGVATYGFSISPAVVTTESFCLFLRDGGMLYLVNIDRNWGFAKLRADGLPDTNFGNAGVIAVRDIPIWNSPHVQELPDGRLMVGANIYNGRGQYVLARFNADGTPDATFATGGRGVFGFESKRHASHFAMADGSILLFGSGAPLQIIRLLSDGSLDTAYGNGGMRSFGFATNYSLSSNEPIIKQQADGKILFCYALNDTNYRVMRLNVDGTPDDTFGNSGVASLPGSWFSVLVSPYRLLPLPSGEFLWSGAKGISRISNTGTVLTTMAGGRLMGLTSDGKVLHNSALNPNGTTYQLLDTTTWSSTQSPWSGPYGSLGEAVPDPRGGFLIRTRASYSAPYKFTKHQANGTLDPAVGNAGVLNLQWHPPGDCSRIRLQESRSGGLSMMFDQGFDQWDYQYGKADFIRRTGTRHLVGIDAAGMPGVPQLVGDRSSLIVADLDRDGSCLLLKDRTLTRLQTDGARQTVPLARMPSFDVTSITSTWDGGFLLGGHRPVYSYTRSSLARYSARGGLQKTLHLPYFTGPVIDFLPDGLGGWHLGIYHGTSNWSSDRYELIESGRISPAFRWDLGSSSNFVDFRMAASEEVPILILPGSAPTALLQGMYQDFGTWSARQPAKVVLPTRTIELPEFEGEITGAADSDGGFVVAGAVARGHAVRRITRSGTLDTSFGGEFPSQDGDRDIISKVYRSKTGVWWVAGGTKDLSTYRLFIAKLAPQPFVATLLEPDRPLVLNRLTGLLEHRVLVTNHSGKTEDLILRISDMPPIVRSVYRAPEQVLAGTSGKKAWTVPVAGLPAGQSRTVTLGYYALTRQPLVFTPVLEVSASAEEKP